VFDAGVLDDGRPFYVMERLSGCDLRRELTRLGALSVPSSLRVVTELLHALGQLHARGVVHADLKAENVLLTDSGRVVLLDLGAACLAGSKRREPRVGTPRSMAPEQFGEGPIDQRADIYAVGLLLFELLVGRGPYDARGACREWLESAHTSRTPSAPSTRAPQRVPYELDAVVLRALSKRPEDRFESTDDMVTALLEASVREIDLDRTHDAWT
jgi:serine/threonine protein kinase